ncbi:hypothetical protein D4R52_00650 [bacterium]|nr:MAG: hypothetical protein D4R52_00650 [bacterium]
MQNYLTNPWIGWVAIVILSAVGCLIYRIATRRSRTKNPALLLDCTIPVSHPDTDELYFYYKGGIAPDKKDYVESHVQSCRDCRRQIQNFGEMDRMNKTHFHGGAPVSCGVETARTSGEEKGWQKHAGTGGGHHHHHMHPAKR